MRKIKICLKASTIPVLLILYFLALHNKPKARTDLHTKMGIEIAPKLPKKYVEPYRVKYEYSLDRGNSTKLPLAMRNSDRTVLMETLRKMCRFFGEKDIEWMISDGSMIGSLRHWDIVPWDDDFDVRVNPDQDNLFQLLNSTALGEKYGLGCSLHYQSDITNLVIKLFDLNSTPIKKGSSEFKKYKFPYVDIFFYSQNRTHLWYEEPDESRVKRGQQYIPLDSVFPLQLRPMGDYWLPGARNPLVYLDNYHPGGIRNKCIRGDWNHRLEEYQDSKSVNCSDLMNDYFFVSRECTQYGCLEKLMRENVIYKEILFPYD